MALRLYNTYTRKKEDLAPVTPGKLGMYVCGVTVYDASHIGHARCYVAFDVVLRILRHKGYEVTYVRNFTDVDDKIIKRAAEVGISSHELASRNIDLFHEDMDSLGCLRPDVEPRVTDHMPDIIALVQRIIDHGHAYVAPDGAVYFSIDSFPRYGELSRRNLDEMIAGASERVEADPNKRNPLDFVLWKPSKPGEPTWDSPWCAGRPGWHIECSAMSCRHLGEVFDIHGGGKDLVFPHHENERAQSMAATGRKFASYWMHNGFVNVDEEKMSKSLGNFFTIRDVTRIFHPEAIRMFLLSTHYRSPINYSNRNLEEATGRLEYMAESLQALRAEVAAGGVEGENLCPDVKGLEAQFEEALEDDFNSAAALGNLFELFRLANEWSKKKRKLPGRLTTLKLMAEVLARCTGTLGILQAPPERLLDGIRARDIVRLALDVPRIEGLIAERNRARQEKDYAQADALRTQLSGMGISLMDGPQGTAWKVDRAMER
jgi:cysteinyl-tRNA synthetase